MNKLTHKFKVEITVEKGFFLKKEVQSYMNDFFREQLVSMPDKFQSFYDIKTKSIRLNGIKIL